MIIVTPPIPLHAPPGPGLVSHLWGKSLVDEGWSVEWRHCRRDLESGVNKFACGAVVSEFEVFFRSSVTAIPTPTGWVFRIAFIGEG